MFKNLTLTVKSMVVVYDDCPIRYTASVNDGADFVFGSPPDDDFELSFTTGALRRFVELGIKALDEMGVPYVQEGPDVASRANVRAAEMVAAGEQG